MNHFDIAKHEIAHLAGYAIAARHRKLATKKAVALVHVAHGDGEAAVMCNDWSAKDLAYVHHVASYAPIALAGETYAKSYIYTHRTPSLEGAAALSASDRDGAKHVSHGELARNVAGVACYLRELGPRRLDALADALAKDLSHAEWQLDEIIRPRLVTMAFAFERDFYTKARAGRFAHA